MVTSEPFPEASPGGPSEVKRAAQYIRASTDHQSYSTQNQEHAIQCYAALHQLQIVRSYSDEGKSGLNIAGRLGLQELLSDVQCGRANYDTIVVYDISRWGRFQDTDESAYYEYICRHAKISVVYCAEPFQNDGSPISTIIKGLKRAMAAEYSRELSQKVFIGQCRLVEKGFRQGGRAGFGFRRLLVDQDGRHKEILPYGSSKNIQSDRVVLVKGPDNEVSVVRKIFDLFVYNNFREAAIARILNAEGVLTDMGRPWGRSTVHCILTNEKYIGNSVFGRSAAKLKGTRIPVPKSQWIRKDGAFEGIVDPDIFFRAQAIIVSGKKPVESTVMISKLSKLFRRYGVLTEKLVNKQKNMPPSWAYKTRFGSLLEAYRLAGYVPSHKFGYVIANARLRKFQNLISERVAAGFQSRGHFVTHIDNDHIEVDHCLSIYILAVRAKKLSGGLRWLVFTSTSSDFDILLLARLDESGSDIIDFYILPEFSLPSHEFRLSKDNGVPLDLFRHPEMNSLYELIATDTQG